MTERDLIELKQALERLRDALMEAMRALDEVADSPPLDADPNVDQLDSDPNVDRVAADPYVDHGEPFGPGTRARQLWSAFGQFTTYN